MFSQSAADAPTIVCHHEGGAESEAEGEGEGEFERSGGGMGERAFGVNGKGGGGWW